MPTCTAPDCSRPGCARGLCRPHYERARAAGEFEGDARRVEDPKRTLAVRLGEAERAELEAAAARSGLPLATWIREAALTAARVKRRRS